MNPRYEPYFGSDPVEAAYKVAEVIDRGIEAGVLDRLDAMLQRYELQGGDLRMPVQFDAWLQSRAIRDMASEHEPEVEMTEEQFAKATEFITTIAVSEGVLDAGVASEAGYALQGGVVEMPEVFNAWFGAYCMDVAAGRRRYDPDLLPRLRAERARASVAATPLSPAEQQLARHWQELRGHADALSRFTELWDPRAPGVRLDNIAAVLESAEDLVQRLKTFLGWIKADRPDGPLN